LHVKVSFLTSYKTKGCAKKMHELLNFDFTRRKCVLFLFLDHFIQN